VEREELWTGPTRETHFGSQNLDGSYTTVARGFDNVETRTTLDENGRLNVRKLNPDGTSTESDFNPDGSGHTTTFDANGNPTGDTPIAPVPAAVPRDFNPDRFESDAENHLPADTRLASDPMVGDQPMGSEEISASLSDAELERISERGIAGPDGAHDLDQATALDETTLGEGVMAASTLDELAMPSGALGDPGVFRNFDHIEKEPIAFDNVHGASGTVFTENEDGSIVEGMPGEEPYAEEQTWPEEKIEGMDPIEEYDPIGPDPDAHPLEGAKELLGEEDPVPEEEDYATPTIADPVDDW
jgi:hypothetical protein